jgi:hypothetical protein
MKVTIDRLSDKIALALLVLPGAYMLYMFGVGVGMGIVDVIRGQ